MKKDINGLVELKNDKGDTQKVFPVDAVEIIAQGEWELVEKEKETEKPKKKMFERVVNHEDVKS